MKIVIALLVIIGAFGVGYYYSNPPEACADCGTGTLKTVGVDEFVQSVSSGTATIIDVRTQEEYASGHIEGAVNSDFYDSQAFSEYLDSLDKNSEYLIYCRSGSRSGKTLKMMKDKGFENVLDLSGGIGAWQRAGNDLVN